MAELIMPQSVLFCCDHNAIRSPMAEAIMKQRFGQTFYVQSAGLRSDLEVDGFAVAVCAEIGVKLEHHRTRSFDDLEAWGDELSAFDLVVALSPASRARALVMTRLYHLSVEFWPISDPTGGAEDRASKVAAYRVARDQIIARIDQRFGKGAGH